MYNMYGDNSEFTFNISDYFYIKTYVVGVHTGYINSNTIMRLEN